MNSHVAEWRRLGVTGIAAMRDLAPIVVGSVHSVWTVLAGQITPELLREAERLCAGVWTYDDPDVRMVALRALGSLGHQAARAIPALRRLLAHEDAFIRLGATYTLTLIDDPAAAEPPL